MRSDKPLDVVISALKTVNSASPTVSGDGWRAHCPAHMDGKPSLSIDEGEDSRVLLKCHAGCSVEDICRALGLTTADLFPPKAATSTNSPHSPVRDENVDVDSREPSRSSADSGSAITALERQLGRHSAIWWYLDNNGERVGAIIRWDQPDGKKEIRPIRRTAAGWEIGSMPAPRPLYRLLDLNSASRVYVCEGEKACDAARSIGLVATTSPQGCKAVGKADWMPLAGKDIVILPDNDLPGEDYANAVTEILAKLNPAPTVCVVELPELPEGGDIHDWLEQHDAHDPEELRQTIESLAEQAPQAEPPALGSTVMRYQPFPVDILPRTVRLFVRDCAKSIGCDPSFAALPLLATLGAAIGNTRRLELKVSWRVPPIIWAVIVGESGSAKTPASRPALRLVHRRQAAALQEHMLAERDHDRDMLQFEKTLSEWRRTRKSDEEPPTPPEAPLATRYIVVDTTIEALVPLLLANPRGLLLARDELSGWIGSFDRYAAGSGADAAHWLSMHSGESIIVDRKTGKQKTIPVPNACMCITGGIQPGILHRALGTEHRESGLAARLLLACPPRQPKRWTEDAIGPEIESEMANLLDRLYNLEPIPDAFHKPQPVMVEMTRQAKQAWIAFYNRHGNEQMKLTGDLAAAWSKLEEYAARLALVIHYARWASGELEIETVLDVRSMEAGITLADWFGHEAKRVYARLAESEDDRQQRELIERIEHHGGRITPRKLAQQSRQYQPASHAEEMLNALAKAGIGNWETVPTTTKPRVEFVLTPSQPAREFTPGACPWKRNSAV